MADPQVGGHATRGLPDVDTWMQRIERGLVRIIAVTRLEIGIHFAQRQRRIPELPDLLFAATAKVAG